MPQPPAILMVGLTGGIASGKSTVAARLAELGACVISADKVAHEIIEPGGPAYDAVVERFGAGILSPDGHIVRERLGQIVFNDPEALRALNAIVHPRVRQESARRIEHCAQDGHTWLVIYDAALLVETGTHRNLDRLIVTACSRKNQIARLNERDGMSNADAAARIDAQAPLDDKIDRADYVIDTDGTIEETLRQTDEIYESLHADFKRG